MDGRALPARRELPVQPELPVSEAAAEAAAGQNTVSGTTPTTTSLMTQVAEGAGLPLQLLAAAGEGLLWDPGCSPAERRSQGLPAPQEEPAATMLV